MSNTKKISAKDAERIKKIQEQCKTLPKQYVNAINALIQSGANIELAEQLLIRYSEDFNLWTDLMDKNNKDIANKLETLVSKKKVLDNLNKLNFHLSQCKATTGEILTSDINYCAQLMTRVLKLNS